MSRRKMNNKVETKPVQSSAQLTFSPVNTVIAGGEMIVRNPAPNSSPAAAPTGVYREFRLG